MLATIFNFLSFSRFHYHQDEVLAIAERVVIRADDLLNWCDDAINWTYGLRANTLLTPNIKNETKQKDDRAEAIKIESTNANNTENVPHADNILCSNIRSLKNSKLDFSEIENEKGKFTSFLCFCFYFDWCRAHKAIKWLDALYEPLKMMVHKRFSTEIFS